MRLRAVVLCLLNSLCFAQNPDTTTLDADGTAHIARVVPVPKTLSPEAQKLLATGATWAPEAGSEDQRKLIEQAHAMYPVKVEDKTIAGVPVKIISPATIAKGKQDRILINLHGGGFVGDSGSMLESIPIASLTGTQVITVYYRLAPKYSFPAPVDDVVAVYKELLKTYKPTKMALYGTSAGAILTAQATVRLKKLGLPLPAALGFFTGMADFSSHGDSEAFFGVPGLNEARVPRSTTRDSPLLGGHDPKDPELSPIYADLHGFPPTLCATGTRDVLLSGTANFHRALLRASVDAQLIVFDAMPHAHWYMVAIPEAKEAVRLMAGFFDTKLGRTAP